MHHCLYCHEAANSVEHPLPAALGEFSDAPILINRICKLCNERRIGKLDEQFIRCGPVAVLRKRFGIEGRGHHEKVNSFQRGSAGGRRISFLSWDESLQCELLIELKGGNEARQLTQLILRGEDGPRHHIPLTVTMTAQDLRREIEALNLKFPLPEVRLIYDPATEGWAAELFNKLWPDNPLPENTKGASRFHGGVVQFQTTSRYYRAVAKIGFHYFLTQFPNFSGHESIFSELKSFIVDDVENPSFAHINRFIAIHRTPILPPSNGWVGHLLSAEIRRDGFFAYFEPFVTESGRMQAFMVRLASCDTTIDFGTRSHLYLYYAKGKTGRFSGDCSEIPTHDLNFDMSSCVQAIFEPVG